MKTTKYITIKDRVVNIHSVKALEKLGYIVTVIIIK